MSTAREKQLWAALDPDVRRRAVEVLQREIPAAVKASVRDAIAADPDGWFVLYHFGWGMRVRNLLRTHDLGDNLLPAAEPGDAGGNWDDYYVCAVEEALA